VLIKKQFDEPIYIFKTTLSTELCEGARGRFQTLDNTLGYAGSTAAMSKKRSGENTSPIRKKLEAYIVIEDR
jgi:hypothetical protein